MSTLHYVFVMTYQSAEYAEQLDDISVCDGVQPTKQRVGDGDDGRDDDSDTIVNLNDDGQSRTWKQ